MMGQQEGFQPKLFYHQISLEQRVPKGHLLRRIQEKIDFDFIYGEVKDTYGDNGNVSIPPPVILKLMLLLALYNVRSERELMDTLPMRLDWLWFLGYDLDSEVPNHSVLSKARARWGPKYNFLQFILGKVGHGHWPQIPRQPYFSTNVKDKQKVLPPDWRQSSRVLQ